MKPFVLPDFGAEATPRQRRVVRIVAMLAEHPDGATMAEITAVTGMTKYEAGQAIRHTRPALASKGVAVVNERPERAPANAPHVYRLATDAASIARFVQARAGDSLTRVETVRAVQTVAEARARKGSRRHREAVVRLQRLETIQEELAAMMVG